MGIALNWIAVQGADESALLKQLGFQSCGAASDEVGSEFACAVLPGDWFVLVSGRSRLDLEDLLPIVSASGEALGGEVEEHVMFSRLLGYLSGRQAWAVVHDPDVDVHDVSVEGEPPPPFEDLRSDLARKQASDNTGQVDYMFDVPVRLGQALCGYCTDQSPPVGWTVLEMGIGRHAPQPAPRLAAAIRSELLPSIHSLGWTPMGPPESQGVNLARDRDGDAERMWLEWEDVPPWCSIRVSFAVFDRLAPEAPMKLHGKAGVPWPPLWRRILNGLRSFSQKPPTYEDNVAATLARARDELLAVERLLTQGEPDPRLAISGYKAAMIAVAKTGEAPPPPASSRR